MNFTKKNVLDIIYILAFVSLFSFVFTIIGTWIFRFDNRLFPILTFTFLLISSILCVAIIIYNFFSKKKYEKLEIAFYVTNIFVVIVLTIVGKVLDIITVTSEAVLISAFAELSIVVMLLVTKLLKMKMETTAEIKSNEETREESQNKEIKEVSEAPINETTPEEKPKENI